MLFTTRNFCPTSNPCSTMAMHPLGLMSTVYPFVRNVFPPSSHSTVNSTREFSRIPARRCSARAFSANVSILATVVSSAQRLSSPTATQRAIPRSSQQTHPVLPSTVSTPLPSVNGTSPPSLPTSNANPPLNPNRRLQVLSSRPERRRSLPSRSGGTEARFHHN
jgi:hypothetical protein